MTRSPATEGGLRAYVIEPLGETHMLMTFSDTCVFLKSHAGSEAHCRQLT